LLYILEHEHKIKTDVKSALQYPVITVAFLLIAFFILLTFVIPKFIHIFKREGLDLPLPTRVCIFLYDYMNEYWYLWLAAAVAGIFVLINLLRNKSVRYMLDALSLRIPLVGPILEKTTMSRLTSVFAILHSSGVHVIESMTILSGTLGNSAVSDELRKVRDRMQEGQGIAESLMQAKYITPMVMHMAAVGEESGNLDEMLQEVSKHYDAEVEYAVKSLSEAIGPILTVGLAAVVGFFALAIFMPMWDMFNVSELK
jgi:type IV pilus assembly protein PilC